MSSKQCSHPTCSGETCRRPKKEKKVYHLKRPTVPLKRTPIKRISAKRRKQLKDDKKTQIKDWNFFLEIWEERDHICFESGAWLIGEPLTLYFHHVLEKELYEEYRYCKWNIVLVTWEIHSKCHNDLDHAPKIRAYRDSLIKKLGI